MYPRVGSGLKNDFILPLKDDFNRIIKEFPTEIKHHGFSDIVDNYAPMAKRYTLNNGATLLQLEGGLGKKSGRFEWIIYKNKVTHRMFIENGSSNGIPIKK